MKQSSYGVFEVTLHDAEGSVIGETQAFNDVMSDGLELFLYSRFLEDSASVYYGYTAPFNYVKLGSSRVPNTLDMTDLVEPTFGYYSPLTRSAGTTQDTSNKTTSLPQTESQQLKGLNPTTTTHLFAFGRTDVSRGTYNEIGLFTHDPETKAPLQMVCRAVFPEPVTVPKEAYLLVRYRVDITHGAMTGYVADADGKNVHFGMRAPTQWSGSMAEHYSGETTFITRARIRLAENYSFPGKVILSEFDKDTNSRIVQLEFANDSVLPMRFYGAMLNYGAMQSIFSATLPMMVQPGKKVVVKLRQSINHGMQRFQMEGTVTPSLYQPPSNLNASPYNAVPSYGFSRIEFYVGEQMIASGVPNQSGSITSWSTTNNSMYSNNYVVSYKAYDELGRVYQGRNFLPSAQAGTVVYSAPSIGYVAASHSLSVPKPPSSVTHLRVFSFQNPHITQDFPVGTVATTVALPAEFMDEEQYGFRWVGTNGIGTIGILAPPYPTAYRGIVVDSTRTKYRLLMTPRSRDINIAYRTTTGYESSDQLYLNNNTWFELGENITHFLRVPILGADGVTITPTDFVVADLPVDDLPTEITDFVPFEEVTTPVERVPAPSNLYVNETRRILRFTAGVTGGYRLYCSGFEEPVYEGTATVGEVVNLDYRELFDISSRGPLLVRSVKDGVESLPIRFTTLRLGQPANLENMTYDEVTNTLSGKCGYNTAFISIRRWLVSQLDISVDSGTTEFSFPLSISLDPAGRYEVYALSADGQHSQLAFVINEHNEDPLDEPLVDLEKPSEYNRYVYENYQSGSVIPSPNLAKYGADAFGGEYYGEPIITSKVEEVESGRWKCEFSTRNWKYKYQLYDGNLHEGYSTELYKEGYNYTGPWPAGTYHFSCTMWSTWLPFSWDGYDAFVLNGNIRRPFRQSDASYIGVTVNHATGYYRMIIDSYRWNSQGIPSGFIFDFTDKNKDLSIEEQLTNRIGHHLRPTREPQDFYIYINGIRATTTKVLDEDDNHVKWVISTPDYTYEQYPEAGSLWKLVSNVDRIDKPEFADTVIKIELGSVGFDLGNSPYQTAKNDNFNTSTYRGDHYGAFVYVYQWSGYNASMTYYIQPYVSRKPMVVVVPGPENFSDAVVDFEDVGKRYGIVNFYIQGVLVTPTPLSTDASGAVDSYELRLGENVVRYKDNIFTVISEEDGPFVFAFASKNSGDYVSFYGNPFSFSGEAPYGESYNGYAFYMSTSGMSNTPLQWRELTPPPVDMDVTNTTIKLKPEIFHRQLDIKVDGKEVNVQELDDHALFTIGSKESPIDSSITFVDDIQYGTNDRWPDAEEDTIYWDVTVITSTGEAQGTANSWDDNYVEGIVSQLSNGDIQSSYINGHSGGPFNDTGADLILEITAIFDDGTAVKVPTITKSNDQKYPIDPVTGVMSFTYGQGPMTFEYSSYTSGMNSKSVSYRVILLDNDRNEIASYVGGALHTALDTVFASVMKVVPGRLVLRNTSANPVTVKLKPSQEYVNMMDIDGSNSTYVNDEATGEITFTLQPNPLTIFKYNPVTQSLDFLRGENKKFVFTLHDLDVQEWSAKDQFLRNLIKGMGVVGTEIVSAYRSLSFISVASFVMDSADYFKDPSESGLEPYTFPELDGKFVYVRPTSDALISMNIIGASVEDLMAAGPDVDKTAVFVERIAKIFTATINGEVAEVIGDFNLSMDAPEPYLVVGFKAGEIEIIQRFSVDMSQGIPLMTGFKINREFVEGDAPVQLIVSPLAMYSRDSYNAFSNSAGDPLTRSSNNVYYKLVNTAVFSRETLMIMFGPDNGKPEVSAGNFQLNLRPTSMAADLTLEYTNGPAYGSGAQMPDVWSGRFTADQFQVRVNGVLGTLHYNGSTLENYMDDRYILSTSPAFANMLERFASPPPGNIEPEQPMAMAMESSSGLPEPEFPWEQDTDGLYISCGELLFAYSPFTPQGWYLINGDGGYYQIEIAGPVLPYLDEMPAFLPAPYPDHAMENGIVYEMQMPRWYGRPSEDSVGSYVVTGSPNDLPMPPPGNIEPEQPMAMAMMAEVATPSSLEDPSETEVSMVTEYAYSALITPPAVDGIMYSHEGQFDVANMLIDPEAPLLGADTTVVPFAITAPLFYARWKIDGEDAWFDEDYGVPDSQSYTSQGILANGPEAPKIWSPIDAVNDDGQPIIPEGQIDPDTSGQVFRLTNGTTSLFYDTRIKAWYQDGEPNGIHTVQFAYLRTPAEGYGDVQWVFYDWTSTTLLTPACAFYQSNGRENDRLYAYGAFHIGAKPQANLEVSDSGLFHELVQNPEIDSPIFWSSADHFEVPNWKQHPLSSFQFRLGGSLIEPSNVVTNSDTGQVDSFDIYDELSGYGVTFSWTEDDGAGTVFISRVPEDFIPWMRGTDPMASNMWGSDMDNGGGGGVKLASVASDAVMPMALTSPEGMEDQSNNPVTRIFTGPYLADPDATNQRTCFTPDYRIGLEVTTTVPDDIHEYSTHFVDDMGLYAQATYAAKQVLTNGTEKIISVYYPLIHEDDYSINPASRLFGRSVDQNTTSYTGFGPDMIGQRRSPDSFFGGGGGGSVEVS